MITKLPTKWIHIKIKYKQFRHHIKHNKLKRTFVFGKIKVEYSQIKQ